MGSKTVGLDDEAYDRLEAQKREGESFSDTVKRITEKSLPAGDTASVRTTATEPRRSPTPSKGATKPRTVGVLGGTLCIAGWRTSVRYVRGPSKGITSIVGDRCPRHQQRYRSSEAGTPNSTGPLGHRF